MNELKKFLERLNKKKKPIFRVIKKKFVMGMERKSRNYNWKIWLLKKNQRRLKIKMIKLVEIQVIKKYLTSLKCRDWN